MMLNDLVVRYPLMLANAVTEKIVERGPRIL